MRIFIRKYLIKDIKLRLMLKAISVANARFMLASVSAFRGSFALDSRIRTGSFLGSGHSQSGTGNWFADLAGR